MQEILGYVACILTTIYQIPQIYHLFKCKKTEGISLTTYYVLIVALCVWLIYGIMAGDKFIVICNALSISLNILILYLVFKCNKNRKAGL